MLHLLNVISMLASSIATFVQHNWTSGECLMLYTAMSYKCYHLLFFAGNLKKLSILKAEQNQILAIPVTIGKYVWSLIPIIYMIKYAVAAVKWSHSFFSEVHVATLS